MLCRTIHCRKLWGLRSDKLQLSSYHRKLRLLVWPVWKAACRRSKMRCFARTCECLLSRIISGVLPHIFGGFGHTSVLANIYSLLANIYSFLYHTWCRTCMAPARKCRLWFVQLRCFVHGIYTDSSWFCGYVSNAVVTCIDHCLCFGYRFIDVWVHKAGALWCMAWPTIWIGQIGEIRYTSAIFAKTLGVRSQLSKGTITVTSILKRNILRNE